MITFDKISTCLVMLYFFGISNWKDLLMNVFGNTNGERCKYSGQEGFENAIQKIKEYEKVNRLKPRSDSKGMGGIYKKCRKGHWKEYGVNSWNDLINYTFKK